MISIFKSLILRQNPWRRSPFTTLASQAWPFSSTRSSVASSNFSCSSSTSRYHSQQSTLLGIIVRSVSSSLPSSDNNETKCPTNTKANYYVPKSERGPGRSAYDIDHMVGETRLTRNSRTCPTRELNFYHTQWGYHKSPYRRFRHMANIFYSAPLQRLIFPDLACIGTIAAGLTYYNEILVGSSAGLVTLSISPAAFAGATTAIGLLVGFRLNYSYARVREGRKAWSEMNTATRNIARQVLMWMNTDIDGNKNDNKQFPSVAQTRMLRLCQAFPVTLMFYSNDKGCHHNMKRKSKRGEAPFEERVMAEFRAELCDIFHSSFKPNNPNVQELLTQDMGRICSVKEQKGNIPLEVLTIMSEITAQACKAASKSTAVDPIYMREIDSQIQRLGLALGSSERLLTTPLPTGFTRHSSRLLFMWSNSLPFALYPLLGPLGTLPTAILSAYAVLGVEDISIQLEEPFDILPLREYSDSMLSAIDAIERSFNSDAMTTDAKRISPI